MSLAFSEHAKTSRADPYHSLMGTNWLDFAVRADADFDIETDVRAPQREEVLRALNNRKPYGGPVPEGLIDRVAAELELPPLCVKWRLAELGYEVAAAPALKVKDHRKGKTGFDLPGRKPTRVAAIKAVLAEHGPLTDEQIAKLTKIPLGKVRESLSRARGLHFKQVPQPRHDNLPWTNIQEKS